MPRLRFFGLAFAFPIKLTLPFDSRAGCPDNSVPGCSPAFRADEADADAGTCPSDLAGGTPPLSEDELLEDVEAPEFDSSADAGEGGELDDDDDMSISPQPILITLIIILDDPITRPQTEKQRKNMKI